VGWVFEKGYKQIKHLMPIDVFQTTSDWCDFFPFDPSNPIAKEYYSADYKEYTRFMLENGYTPFIYELLNEPYYNSFSKENVSNFRNWIDERYKNIENANKQWGSNFKNTEEVISTVNEKRAMMDKVSQGLWIEWMDFVSDVLSDHLKDFKNDVLSVDKRPVPKYFTVQPHCFDNNKNTAFDYTKLMDWFDVMTLEYGGPVYGNSQGSKEDNPYSAGLNMDRMQSMLLMDLARAIADGKPVCDDEMASRRIENNIRVTSGDYDLGTSLWEQIMHGISSSLIYTWGSRSVEWKDFEGAKKNALQALYTESYLQNPYNYSLESLKDLKRSRNEIDKLSEIVLPTPRTKGKVGIIFAHKHFWLRGKPDNNDFCLLQDALVNLHIPYDYLVDSYLKKKNNLKEYSAILTPCLQYCPPHLRTKLEEYVKSGGVLISFPQSFTADDYGKATEYESFLGVRFEKLKKRSKKELEFVVPVEDSRYLGKVSLEVILKPTTAEVFTKSKDDELPIITRQNLGKGKIYTLSFIKTEDMCLSSILSTIFKEEKIKKEVDVRRISDGELEDSVELNYVNRGDKKVVHLVNWSTLPKLSKLKFQNIDKGYYLVDVVEWKGILNPEEKPLWSKSDIDKGIDVLLPSQKRVLIFFSSTPIADLSGSIKIKEIYREYEVIKEMGSSKQEESEKKIAEMKNTIDKNRMFDGIDKKNTFQIDLSKYVNMGFMDEVAGDGKGGWTDAGENDMRELPVGEHNFYGVLYNIIDPEKNNGKSAIVLNLSKHSDFKHFPNEVRDIEVGKKASNLYFLHAVAWGDGQILFKYVINYGNKTKVEVPITNGTCCKDWWQPKDEALKGEEVKVGWAGNNPVAENGVGLYTYKWKNPYPDLEIKSIDIISMDKVVPLIVAITGIVGKE